MFKAVIFDMDGVMVDTEHIQSEAFEKILKDYGIVATKNEHGTVHVAGPSSHAMFEIFKKQYEFDADTKELVERKRIEVLKVIEEGVETMPGLHELLQDLQNRNISLAVATSAQRDRLELVTEKIQIGHYFTVTVTASEVMHAKPAPDVYLKAAELLEVPSEECLVFEDSAAGVQAAKAAGMRVIAVPNAYTKRMDFSQADLVIGSLDEMSYDKLDRIF